MLRALFIKQVVPTTFLGTLCRGKQWLLAALIQADVLWTVSFEVLHRERELCTSCITADGSEEAGLAEFQADLICKLAMSFGREPPLQGGGHESPSRTLTLDIFY